MVSLLLGQSCGWSLSLKAPGESPEAASGEAVSSERTFRPSCSSPGAHGVTGGIFCPFLLKHGRTRPAGGFLQGLGGEDPPAPCDSTCRARGAVLVLPSSSPALAGLGLAPGTAKGSVHHRGRAARPWGCWRSPSSQDVWIIVMQPAWSRNSRLPPQGRINQSLQLPGTRAVKPEDGESDAGPAELTLPCASLPAGPWRRKGGQLIPQAVPAVPSLTSL